MLSDVQLLDVLIASPGDANTGRDAVEQAILGWNAHRGDSEGLMLRPRRWETDSVPLLGQGDAQSVINAQLVDDADIILAIFYHRLGSATHRAKSGTAEEIERSIARGKPVHLYFSEKPVPYNHDAKQFKALRKFRLEMQGRGLVATFRKESELSLEVGRAIEFDVAHLRGAGPLKKVQMPSALNEADAAHNQQFTVKYWEGFTIGIPPGQKDPNRGVASLYVSNIGPNTVMSLTVSFRAHGQTETPIPLSGPDILEPSQGARYAPTSKERPRWNHHGFPGSIYLKWRENGLDKANTFRLALPHGEPET